MWCDGGSREKILFYINCASQEMLFPSATFKCFTKKIIIIKQTSHSLLSGTYSVYSCYLYVRAMCTKVPVFSYYMLFCANIFTLLLISKMNVNYYESECHMVIMSCELLHWSCFLQVIPPTYIFLYIWDMWDTKFTPFDKAKIEIQPRIHSLGGGGECELMFLIIAVD